MAIRVPGYDALGKPEVTGGLPPAQMDDRAAFYVGSAYARLGESIAEMGEQWQKSKDANSEAQLEINTFKAGKEAEEAARTGAGPAGENYTSIYMDHMQKYQQSPDYQGVVGGMSGAAQQRANARINLQLTKQGFAAQDHERTMRTGWTVDQLQERAKERGGMVMLNPGLYEEELRKSLVDIDAQQAAGAINASKAAELRTTITNQLNATKINAAILYNPEAFLNFIGGSLGRQMQQGAGQRPGGVPLQVPGTITPGGFGAAPEATGPGISSSTQVVPEGRSVAAPDTGFVAQQPIATLPGAAPRKPSNDVTLPNGQVVTSNATPFQVASKYIGVKEGPHAAIIANFLKNSAGHNIDPRSTAWCAGFVNAALGASGIKGTGSLAAKSFMAFGAATNNPQQGDVIVLSRGAPNGPYGHVGFFAGWGEGGRTVKILGGNQSDAVSVTEFPANRILGMRRPPSPGSAPTAGAAGPTGLGSGSANALLGTSPSVQFGSASMPSFKMAGTKSDGSPTDIEITTADIARLGPAGVATLVEKGRQQLRVGLDDKIKDTMELLKDGHAAPDYLGLSNTIRQAYPPVQAQKFIDNLEEAGRVGEGVRALDGKPFTEYNTILKSYEPDPNSGNYADQKANYNTLVTAANRRKEEAGKDPTAYTIKHSTTAKVAVASLSEGAEVSSEDQRANSEAVIDTLLNEQRRLGIDPDKIRVASVGQMQGLAAGLTNPNLYQNTQALGQQIKAIEQRYGKHTPRLLAELAPYGVDNSFVAFQSITNDAVRGDLLEAISRDKMPDGIFRKGLEESTKDITGAVTSAMAPFRNSLLPTSKENLLLKGGMDRAALLLTYKYMQDRSMSATEASTLAAKNLFEQYSFVEGRTAGKSVRIPMLTAQQPNGLLPEDVNKVQGTINGFSGVIDSIQDRLATPPGLPGVARADNQRQFAAALKGKGFLQTNETETGVVLFDERSQPVMLDDGRYAEFTWEQLKNWEVTRLQKLGAGEGGAAPSHLPMLGKDQLPPQQPGRFAPTRSVPSGLNLRDYYPKGEVPQWFKDAFGKEFGEEVDKAKATASAVAGAAGEVAKSSVNPAGLPGPLTQPEVHARLRQAIEGVYGAGLSMFMNKPDERRLAVEQAQQTPPTRGNVVNFLTGEHLQEFLERPGVAEVLAQLTTQKKKPGEQEANPEDVINILAGEHLQPPKRKRK